MRKLNQKKVKWIVREMERGTPSRLAAGVQKISQRRAQQLYRKYRDTGEIPLLKRCGRKKRELTKDERDIVLEAYKEYRVNALALEKVIDRHYKTHIPQIKSIRYLRTTTKQRMSPINKNVRLNVTKSS